MNLDSIQDSTRVVVSSVRHGSILPGNRAEMWRDLFFLPGADLRGAAFGNQAIIEGPDVQIRSSMYVRGEIRIKSANQTDARKKPVSFGSCVTTGDTLLIEDAPFRVRFLSNLYVTKAVHINNAIVYGNLYAQHAIIKNSVILGGVFCRENLQIQDSIIATFRAQKAVLGQNVFLSFPIAIAEKSLDMQHPVHAVSFFKMAKGANKNDQGGVVELDSSDVYVIDNQWLPEDSEQTGMYVLSLDHRVMDSKKIIEHFKENKRFLESLTLVNHLRPELQEAKKQNELLEIENSLFRLIGKESLPTMTGASDFSEIIQREELLESIRRFISPEAADLIARYSAEESLKTTAGA